MPDEDKNFGGSSVLVLRKWWRHVKTIYNIKDSARECHSRIWGRHDLTSELTSKESLVTRRKINSSLFSWTKSSWTKSCSKSTSDVSHLGRWPILEGPLNLKLGQKAFQWPGLPQVKHKPDANLWDECCGFTRENKLGSCEAKSCAVVEVDVTLLLCWIEREVKRFVDLAALDSALRMIFVVCEIVMLELEDRLPSVLSFISQ